MTERVGCPESSTPEDDELPGMLAVAKGVAEQTFPHTMDAAVWAAEYVKLNPGADEGTMIVWFANAIMAGYDTAQARATRSAGTRIPEGWKLVPERPNGPMLMAACRVLDPAGNVMWDGIKEAAKRYYNAMVDAAPTPPPSLQSASERTSDLPNGVWKCGSLTCEPPCRCSPPVPPNHKPAA